MAKKKKMVAAGRIKNQNEMKADPEGSIFAGGTQIDRKHFQDAQDKKVRTMIRAERIGAKLTNDDVPLTDRTYASPEYSAVDNEQREQRKAGIQYGHKHTVQDRATDRRRVVDRRIY
jgi:hypothetical protein